jgi:hypothetical protein
LDRWVRREVDRSEKFPFINRQGFFDGWYGLHGDDYSVNQIFGVLVSIKRKKAFWRVWKGCFWWF